MGKKKKAKKVNPKKEKYAKFRKEKPLNYYSGWHKGKPIREEKTEKQTKL